MQGLPLFRRLCQQLRVRIPRVTWDRNPTEEAPLSQDLEPSKSESEKLTSFERAFIQASERHEITLAKVLEGQTAAISGQQALITMTMEGLRAVIQRQTELITAVKSQRQQPKDYQIFLTLGTVLAGLAASVAVVIASRQFQTVEQRLEAAKLQVTGIQKTPAEQAASVMRVLMTRQPAAAEAAGFNAMIPRVRIPAPAGFLWVEGPQGIGKTEACKKLVRDVQEAGGLAFYCDLCGIPSSDVVDTVLAELGILPRVTKGVKWHSLDDFTQALRDIHRQRVEANEKFVRPILVINEAHLLLEGEDATIRTSIAFVHRLLSLWIDGCVLVAFVSSKPNAGYDLRWRVSGGNRLRMVSVDYCPKQQMGEALRWLFNVGKDRDAIVDEIWNTVGSNFVDIGYFLSTLESLHASKERSGETDLPSLMRLLDARSPLHPLSFVPTDEEIIVARNTLVAAAQSHLNHVINGLPSAIRTRARSVLEQLARAPVAAHSLPSDIRYALTDASLIYWNDGMMHVYRPVQRAALLANLSCRSSAPAAVTDSVKLLWPGARCGHRQDS